MPTPPATFSPLTTTKSRANSSRSLGRSSRSARRPAEPTTSPTNRIAVISPTVAVQTRSPEGTYWVHAARARRAGLRARAAGRAAGAPGRGRGDEHAARRGGRAGGRAALGPAGDPATGDRRAGRPAAGGRADRPGVHDRRADRDAAQPVRHGPAPARRAARTGGPDHLAGRAARDRRDRGAAGQPDR